MLNPTVLLVDSDADSRFVFSSMLRHHGYAVREARDAEAGLRLAWTLPPDLVVAELRLPRMDGCDFVETLRLHVSCAAVPCVLLGTDPSAGTRERALRAGCCLYLLKPLSPSELVDAVTQVLARSRPARGAGSPLPGLAATARSGPLGSRPLGA